jgi:DNA-binding SARP family transcriptional activator
MTQLTNARRLEIARSMTMEDREKYAADVWELDDHINDVIDAWADAHRAQYEDDKASFGEWVESVDVTGPRARKAWEYAERLDATLTPVDREIMTRRLIAYQPW